MRQEDYDVAFVLEVKMALSDVYKNSGGASKESRIILKNMIIKYEELLVRLMEENFGGDDDNFTRLLN